MREIYVVCWHYSNRSANGVVRAFEREADALDFQKILQEQAGDTRDFEVITTFLVNAY